MLDSVIIKIVENGKNRECMYLVEFVNKSLKAKGGTHNNRMIVGIYTVWIPGDLYQSYGAKTLQVLVCIINFMIRDHIPKPCGE